MLLLEKSKCVLVIQSETSHKSWVVGQMVGWCVRWSVIISYKRLGNYTSNNLSEHFFLIALPFLIKRHLFLNNLPLIWSLVCGVIYVSIIKSMVYVKVYMMNLTNFVSAEYISIVFPVNLGTTLTLQLL